MPSKEQKRSRSGSGYVVVALVVAAVLLIGLYVLSSSTTVPFSTFKQNFDNSQRVSVAVTYYNQTQYNDVSPCFSSIIQVVSHDRQASTIDFFLLNRTSCTYSKTGLGGQVVPATTNASYCLNIARSEPGIFLNFSQSTRTVVTPYRLYVYGNSSYMNECPVAIDLA